MVCVSPESRVNESESRVQCIVRHIDMHTAGSDKFEITFPASTPVKDLIDAVASNYEVDSSDVELQYQSIQQLPSKKWINPDPARCPSYDQVEDPGKTTISISPLQCAITAKQAWVTCWEFVIGTQFNRLMKVFTERTEGTLGSIGLNTEYGARNSMSLKVNNPDFAGSSRMKRPKTCVASQEIAQDATSSIPLPPNESPSVDENARKNLSNWSSWGTGSDKASSHSTLERHLSHEAGFVGLVNQAMTCYLNSLLQALFMTPEFRNAMYKWKYNPSQGPEPEKSIPYQLQKLFLNLQTSLKTAVETTELTKSFGWESGDVWQQHDIQELCRVMFDALECEFKNTEQADLINMLYQGKMIDYVKCLECGTEKSKEDVFLDIPLPVRPFGSTKAYKDIEEAMRAFVRPEILEENNQYFCDACNKKCNAHKGLKFSKFPYLLTLHLKRFDFDYRIMHRIKLNDKVTFPKILDLNSFIQNSETAEEEILETIIKCDDSSTTDSVLDEETNHVSNDTPSFDTDQEDDEGVDLSNNSINSAENEKNITQSLSKGPFVYELYSIMIHSGSASGGHYYAYIKDFTHGEWYCFNDQTVSPITAKDIVKTFGGAPNRSYYNGVLSSSTNAYMLMYRQIDTTQNCSAMTADDFPPHIMNILQVIKENEERERALKAKEDEMVKMKIHCDHPVANQRSTRIYIHNEESLAAALTLSLSQLNLSKYITEDQCRLVLYNKDKEMSFDGQEKCSIKEIVNSIERIKSRSSLEFFLETREKDKKFFPYNFGDIFLTVYLVDVDNCDVISATVVRTNPLQSVDEFKEFLKEAIPLESSNVHVVVARNNVVRPICSTSNPSSESVRELKLFSDDRIFITPIKLKEDSLENFKKCVYELRNVIVLQLALPENLEDECDTLLIPLLSDKSDQLKATDPSPVTVENGQQRINGIEEELVCSGTSGTSDQSASEDSSLTDSERTIIGDTEVGTTDVWLSSGSDSEQLLSPGKPSLNTTSGEEEGATSWSPDMNAKTHNSFYFRAELITEVAGAPTATGDHKVLKVAVDRNVHMDALKSELERYVGVSKKYLQLNYSRGEALEQVHRSLLNNKDNDKLVISLNRLLEPDEFCAILYNLNLNARSQMQHKPVELVLSRKKTVGESKKDIVKVLGKKGWKVPIDRLRLRVNESKSPGSVLLDEFVWEDHIHQSDSIVLFFQCLEEPEKVTANTLMIVFARRWIPSTMSLEPYCEIVVNNHNEFLDKLSELSGIPSETIEFSKPSNRFPCEMNNLDVIDLEWTRNEEQLLRWKHCKGLVIFFKDNQDKPKEDDEEAGQRGSSSSSSPAPPSSPYIVSYSPRKEKGLKINSWNNNKSPNRVVD